MRCFVALTVVALTLVLPLQTFAGSAHSYSFPSIDGGDLDFAEYAGRPVLVVNTASQCGYTNQYANLQAVYDKYRDRGLVVVAVPSDDFNQELSSEAEVKEFCELNYDLDVPMTEITHVRGSDAHPFYAWLSETQGFEPRWNFNKVLLDGEGAVVETFGSRVKPDAPRITRQIEAMLGS